MTTKERYGGVMDAGRGGAPVSAYVSQPVRFSDDYRSPRRFRGAALEDILQFADHFDARPVLDRFSLSFVEGLEAHRCDEATDEVFYMACEMGLCEPLDPPFACCLEDGDALAAYVEARRAREA